MLAAADISRCVVNAERSRMAVFKKSNNKTAYAFLSALLCSKADCDMAALPSAVQPAVVSAISLTLAPQCQAFHYLMNFDLGHVTAYVYTLYVTNMPYSNGELVLPYSFA